MQEKSWKNLFVFLALARFFSLVPFVVDDDEAWWTVAARSLTSPFQYYFRAVDHKPPGIVWFMQFFSSDPRMTRFCFGVLLVGAALLLGNLASRLKNEISKIDWKAACFFLFATTMGNPKLLTTTADGVLILFVVAGYFVALFGAFTGASFVAGVLLGCALLVKQTAVFFAIPILFARVPKRFTISQILGMAYGAAFVYVPVVFLTNYHEFFYWNWTYPGQVLTRARGDAFDSGLDMLSNSLQFALVLLPLWFWAAHSKVESWMKDFRFLWLFSGVLGTFLGKGIFLHYFLLTAAPLALLASDGWTQRRFATAWLVAGYSIACLVIALPFSGLFWGNDIAYAKLVATKIDSVGKTLNDHSVMVWGGSTLPLAFSHGNYGGRFILPRFAEPPYDTERTQDLFHQEFEDRHPALIVDLHERGDNRFDNPLESDPFISERVEKSYQLFIDPTLPWAKFYILNSLAERSFSDSRLEVVADYESKKRVYQKFPTYDGEWLFWKQDPLYRTLNALELISHQSQTAKTRQHAEEVFERLKENHDLSEANEFLARQAPLENILPTRSITWWPEVAIVELQPKLFAGKK